MKVNCMLDLYKNTQYKCFKFKIIFQKIKNNFICKHSLPSAGDKVVRTVVVVFDVALGVVFVEVVGVVGVVAVLAEVSLAVCDRSGTATTARIIKFERSFILKSFSSLTLVC